MTAEQLEAAFRKKGEVRGGILFLHPKDALSLIDAARQHKIRVLGIDAFSLSAEATRPMMEHSIDLAKPNMDDPWTAATDFVRRYDGTKFSFEVVLE
jgi:hypothetical protein